MSGGLATNAPAPMGPLHRTLRNGFAPLHIVMRVKGDRAIAGHLHEAVIGTHFARAYVTPTAT